MPTPPEIPALTWVRDPEVSACYARLTDQPIMRTIPAGPGVNFDVDAAGRPTGVEVLGSADWVAQLVKLFMRGEVRLVHGFETDDEAPAEEHT